MMMGIDLNMAEEEEEEGEGAEEGEKEDEYSSSPAAAAAPGVCMELWHACAGPLISLPKKGSVVVYLPQGHLEHLRSSATEGGGGGFSYSYNVPPPHVFCRVIHVNLHADAATDEVFAQLSLVGLSQDAEQQLGEGEVEGEVGEGEDEEEFNGVSSSSRSSLMPHMFCKTLTASDTSTHGGFSVPRRAAEDCFPPLDYNKQRPSQELIAKDLHGTEWKFRHIYRGQPRRHLLTTGWSSFVNKKKLVSGDAVLFLRGNNGELRLGVRRAAQLKSSIPCSVRNQNTNAGTLAAVADALSSKSLFNIFYSPRASPSEFIIPYPKFTKSLTYSFSIGTRFKMRYESEDAGERRYTGWITGVSDMDPIRWTGSKWRCLVVRWDDDVDASRQNRVSPWEIEPTGSISGSIGLSSSISKRTKVCLPSANPDFPHPNGSGILDLGESARFPKVLQGQELFGFRSPYGGAGVTSHYPEMRSTTSINYGIPSDGRGSGARVPVGGSEFSYKCTGFGESVRFNEVLQGQEIFLLNPPCTGSHAQNCGFGFVEDGRRCSAPCQGYGGLALPSTTSAQVSSPSSVLMFQPTSQLLCQQSIYISNNCNKGDNDRKVASLLSPTPYIGSRFNKEQSEQRAHVEQNHGRNSCKLFGFSLTETIPVLNGEDDSTSPALPTVIEANFGTSSLPTEPHTPNSSIGRSCTAKVHKQGSLVGKVIDLSKFDGYDSLIRELERLFDMQGLLNDKNQNKWHVVYTDDENDMMLVGDDPWQEFCNVASRILIYNHDEGMIACRMTK